MKRRKRAVGITPSFPALRENLIPPIGVHPPPKNNVAGCLPGIDLKAISNAAPTLGSRRALRAFDAYYASDIWKQRAARRLALANYQCSVDGCPSRAVQVHHNVYTERWGTGREFDSELDPLCLPHHATADEERQEAFRRYAEEAYDDAVKTSKRNRDFHRWMCRNHGRNYEDDFNGAGLEEAREEYERSLE